MSDCSTTESADLDLTYALLDNPDLAILIDATPQGCAPGTLYTIEPESDDRGDAKR